MSHRRQALLPPCFVCGAPASVRDSQTGEVYCPPHYTLLHELR